MTEKKRMALVCAAILSAAVLSGCGGEKITKKHAPAEKYEIVLEDLTTGDNQPALDYVNSLGFSDVDFRQSFYDYLADGTGNCFINAKQEDVVTIEIDEVEDLTDVRLFPNLRKVIIINSDIEDFSPLEQLKNLEILEFIYTDADCTGLANISTKRLSFLHSDPINTEALAGIKGVQELEINYSHFHNIDFLKNWTSLKRLFLRNADIDSFEVLRDKNFDLLKIAYCQVDDWSFIKSIKAKELDLSYSNFSDFSLINGKRLETLNLSYSFISDVDGISDFKDLQELNIESCQNLTEFNEVAELKKLKSFDCSNLEMQIDHRKIMDIMNASKEFEGYDTQVQHQVIELYDSLGITEDMSDEEKIRLISIAVLDLLQFKKDITVEDTFYYNNHELSSVLQHEGNCASYTGITGALLDLAGIENASIVGENLRDNENYLHRWIVVKLNGEWKGLDTTFLDDIDAVDALRRGEDPDYFLADLDDETWMEYHYPYFMPETDPRVVFAR